MKDYLCLFNLASSALPAAMNAEVTCRITELTMTRSRGFRSKSSVIRYGAGGLDAQPVKSRILTRYYCPDQLMVLGECPSCGNEQRFLPLW